MADPVFEIEIPSTMFRLFTASIFAISILLSLSAVSRGQSPPGKNQTDTTTKQKAEDPEILRWKIALSGLAHESRTAFPEERRPYAMVEVANAYWNIDRDASRDLYFSSLDAALWSARQDKKFRRLINYVLSAATKRDAGLARDLNKRLVDQDRSRDSIAPETALEMLEENPEAAAQLAEAFAPNGLQDGTATFLIFALAKKDIRLSDRVYRVYLSKASANENVELESVVNLGGYCFGYSEYYSVGRTGQLSGSSFVPVTGLAPNPAFIGPFLNLASRRLARAIERRNAAVGAEVEALSFPILFASDYLVPEVSRYSPNSGPAWTQLQQRGIVGATSEQARQVRSQINQIYQARSRAQKFGDNSQAPELDAEESLEGVEKLPGTCQRDVIYSKAALVFGDRKNFKRALEIAGKIEDLKQLDKVKEAISIGMIEVEIEAGEFEEAKAKTDRLSSQEHRARLYIALANALATTSDNRQTSQVIDETIKLIEKLPDPGDRAAFLFGTLKVLLKTSPGDAQAALSSGIKHLGKEEPVDEMDFAIPIKVPLSCPGEEVSWYGGFETISNSSVFEAFELLAAQNPDEATRSAEDIGDKITRIRALAIVSGRALNNLLKASRPDRKLPGK